VMVTHDPTLAARAQRRVHIMDGQLLELAPLAEKTLRTGRCVALA